MHTNAAAKRERTSSGVVISDPPGLDLVLAVYAHLAEMRRFGPQIPRQSLGVGTQGASRKLKTIKLARKCKANFVKFCASKGIGLASQRSKPVIMNHLLVTQPWSS